MHPQEKRLYELKAEMIQAIAHPIRLAILEYLRDGEQCVCDIAAHVRAGRSNVSRHLAVMLRAGVLQCRREGLKALYSLRTPCLAACLECVTLALREQLAGNNALLRRL